MTEPRQFSRRTVLLARAFLVAAGSILIGLGAYMETITVPGIRYLGFGLEVLGAAILGFGAFAPGNPCVIVLSRFLQLLGMRGS